MRNTDLNTAAATVETNLKIVKRLADIAQEIRFDLPAGYSAPRDRDGIRRPVESVVIAQQDRGVMREITRAVNALDQAALLVADAARAMDTAITRWDAPKKKR